MTTTDFLGLDGHEIFKNIRDSLPENINRTQNMLAIKDGMLYAWDFRDNCVLTLNVKTARTCEARDVKPQTLLSQYPPLFTPDRLLVNENNTLLSIFGPNGVLIIELPARCPPFGDFDNSKELIYCRSYSLQEGILAFSNNLEVRQVRFHPGSIDDNHVLVLTSDNLLRLFNVSDGVASLIGNYPVGIQPIGRFPTTKISYLEALGDVAIDFDFGPPEKKRLNNNGLNSFNVESTYTTASNVVDLRSGVTPRYQKTNFVKTSKKGGESSLDWPIFVLYGNGDVYIVTIELCGRIPATVKGPMPIQPAVDDAYGKDSCSILCIHTVPPVLCVANSTGTIYHFVLLSVDEEFHFEEDRDRPNYIHNPDKSLYIFESVELELGLATTSSDAKHNCPIFLHNNIGKPGHYFATHETGVHSVNIPCVENLGKFLSKDDDEDLEIDLFNEISTAEYLICTKMTSSEMVNPVIGFTIHYDPFGILVLLAKGQIVSLALSTLVTLSGLDNLEYQNLDTTNLPLKKMLSEPFDVVIQKILKQSTTHPILKLSSSAEHNQQECYELLQRATQIFREEYFKNHNRAREEIEKRVRTLKKLKEIQKNDLERMSKEKQNLQQEAENLAEKYEDIKDKQEELTKRCEKLLISISKTQSEPSNEEKNFIKELKESEAKVEKYRKAIVKLKNRIQYQEIQMKNWHSENKKENVLGSVQSESIKSNLQEMTNKITAMVKEINKYKSQLNLK